jgi:isopentenyl-diphosphate delta-isomerase type 1
MQDQEQFIQVTDNDEIIGPIARKTANSNPELYHRSVKVFVFDAQGKLLIQQRSSQKDTYPNCWDVSVAGHVDWGETNEQAAARECAEEIGIEPTIEALQYMGKLLIRLPWENEFQTSYRWQLAEQPQIQFATDEVQQIRWVSPPELRQMLQEPTCLWTEPARIHIQEYLP